MEKSWKLGQSAKKIGILPRLPSEVLSSLFTINLKQDLSRIFFFFRVLKITVGHFLTVGQEIRNIFLDLVTHRHAAHVLFFESSHLKIFQRNKSTWVLFLDMLPILSST